MSSKTPPMRLQSLDPILDGLSRQIRSSMWSHYKFSSIFVCSPPDFVVVNSNYETCTCIHPSLIILDSKLILQSYMFFFCIWLFLQGIIFMFAKCWGGQSLHSKLIQRSLMKFWSHFWMQNQAKLLSNLSSTLMTIFPSRKELELISIVSKSGCIPLLMQL